MTLIWITVFLFHFFWSSILINDSDYVFLEYNFRKLRKARMMDDAFLSWLDQLSTSLSSHTLNIVTGQWSFSSSSHSLRSRGNHCWGRSTNAVEKSFGELDSWRRIYRKSKFWLFMPRKVELIINLFPELLTGHILSRNCKTRFRDKQVLLRLHFMQKSCCSCRHLWIFVVMEWWLMTVIV